MGEMEGGDLMEQLKVILIGFIAILSVVLIVGVMFLFPKILGVLTLFVVAIFGCWIVGTVITEGR
jgi:hypothetical protein